MPQLNRRFVGLCLPPLLLAAVDGSLTLLGQSAEYWAGNYAQVNELSPTFHHLLSYHPAVFAAGLLCWMLLFSALILLLPQTLALATSIAITFGHMAGMATWLLYRFRFGYQVCNWLFVVSAIILAIGIRWGWGAEPRHDAPLGGRLPITLRWVAIIAVFLITVYLFLWPRTP